MSGQPPPFIGVARSLGGKRWRARGDDDRLGLALSQRFGLPEAVGRIMAARGVQLDALVQAARPQCTWSTSLHRIPSTNLPAGSGKKLLSGRYTKESEKETKQT